VLAAAGAGLALAADESPGDPAAWAAEWIAHRVRAEAASVRAFTRGARLASRALVVNPAALGIRLRNAKQGFQLGRRRPA